jgi:hypothetical protein
MRACGSGIVGNAGWSPGRTCVRRQRRIGGLQAALAIAGAIIGCLGPWEVAQAQPVQACPDPNNCVQVAVSSPADTQGDAVTVALSFAQGPNDARPGGIDEIGTLTLTLSFAGNTTSPSLKSSRW